MFEFPSESKVSSVDQEEELWKFFRLVSESGRQRWFIDESGLHNAGIDHGQISEAFKFKSQPNPNASDLLYRNQSRLTHKERSRPNWLNLPANFTHSLARNAAGAAHKAIDYWTSLQHPCGNWSGDYGGPLFLLPGLIIASYLTQHPFTGVKKVLMKQYMLNHQNPDGGWGLHIEGDSTLFGTVMQYCALRILDMNKEQPCMVKARNWIITNGDARYIPSWGKFFLAVLGVYDWAGCHTLMPELWLLPKSFPLHPSRYWCHARMVYLPMSYCYGKRIHAENSRLISELREEIYTVPYHQISWAKYRSSIAASDKFQKTSGVLDKIYGLLNTYERVHIKKIRARALRFCLDYVVAEDEQTNSIDIGPVNQIINSICIWHAYGGDSKPFKKHVSRWDDYLWLAEDGMKMNGYNGSQLWDTAFSVQAMAENAPAVQCGKSLKQAYTFLDNTQITEEVKNREKFFRHPSAGGWPFSTLEHGWPISDCTAEGLKAVLALHRLHIPDFHGLSHISKDRLKQAVHLILSFQNRDGGWGTYENKRAPDWIEKLNPSGVFGKIMADYSWTECTSACVTALMDYKAYFKDQDFDPEIDDAIKNGIDFIKSMQEANGSWVGSWGICFTYGTWFAVEALVKYGENVFGNGNLPSSEISSACSFLCENQLSDGGWGESHNSCVYNRYISLERSQVVQTSWALLALMAANYPERSVIESGIKFLLSHQLDDGNWPQQAILGVFNQNCMISYASYRNIFPIWALGRYTTTYCRNMTYRK